MFEILSKSIIMVLMIVLGYILKKVGLFAKYDYRVLTKIIMNVTLPAVIITSFSKFEWDNSLLMIPLLGFVTNAIILIISYVYTRNKSDMEKKFFILNTAGCSMGTFALPFIQNLMGTEGIVAACMFDVGQTFMPSGLNYVATCASLSERKQKIGASFIFKRLFSSPPFIIYLIMVVCALTKLGFPDFILDFTGKISEGNAFICMFMIGLMFEMKFQRENLSKVVKILIVRNGVAVIVALLAIYVLPFDIMLRKALAVVVFTPIATINLIWTDKMGGDVELAGFANSLSIILSIILMTVFMAVLAV